MAQAMSSPNTITSAKIRLIDCKGNKRPDVPGRGLNDEQIIIVTVHHKPTVDKNTQMEQQCTVESTDREA